MQHLQSVGIFTFFVSLVTTATFEISCQHTVILSYSLVDHCGPLHLHIGPLRQILPRPLFIMLTLGPGTWYCYIYLKINMVPIQPSLELTK